MTKDVDFHFTNLDMQDLTKLRENCVEILEKYIKF